MVNCAVLFHERNNCIGTKSDDDNGISIIMYGSIEPRGACDIKHYNIHVHVQLHRI